MTSHSDKVTHLRTSRPAVRSGAANSTAGGMAGSFTAAENARFQGAERRRFARVPLHLDALVAIDGDVPIACTVRDFCLGGMFVGCDPEVPPKLSLPVPAVLNFALLVGEERQEHALRLTVVRTVSTGLGVAFDSPDATTLELLAKLATSNGMRPNPQPAGPGQHRDLPPEYARIVTPLIKILAAEIGDLCTRFLDRIDDVLFVAARDAGSNVEETRFLDGQRTMRRLRDRVATEVISLVERAVSLLENPLADTGHPGEGLGLSDLSLVELDEFEEFLLVSKVVSELEPELLEPLTALRKRFSFLASRELDVGSVPISPAVLVYAIAESLKGLELGNEVNARIYSTLRSVMSSSLGPLYAAVNDYFVSQGVLTAIEPDEPTVSAGRPRLGDSGAPEEAPVSAGCDVAEGARDGTQENPTPNHVRATSPSGSRRYVRTASAMSRETVEAAAPTTAQNDVRTAPPTMPPGYVRAAPPLPASTAQTSPLPTTEPTERAASAPKRSAHTNSKAYFLPEGWRASRTNHSAHSLQQVLQLARTQIALRRHQRPASRGAKSKTGGNTGGGDNLVEILRGLLQIQRSAASASQLEHLDPDALAGRVAEALGAEASGAVPLDGEAAQIIELVASLFDALLHDSLIGSDAKVQLARLQPLVHRAALGDSGFFSDSDHPVRQLIGRVARFGDGQGETHQYLAKRLEELIAKANLDYSGDAETCRPIVQELDRILLYQTKEYERQARTFAASSDARESTRKTTSDTTLDGTEQPGKPSDLTEKKNKWFERARALEVGQRVLVSSPTGPARTMSLVWKRSDNRNFAFADALAKRPSMFSLEQVAVSLQHGIFTVLDNDYDERALERAMLGAVDRFHVQVESQTTRDPLTGFLNSRSFVDRVGRELSKLAGSEAQRGTLACISIENVKEVIDAHSVAAAKALIKAFAQTLSVTFCDSEAVFARLGASELAVFWPKKGSESAYRLLQDAMGELRMVSVDPSVLPLHRTESQRRGGGSSAVPHDATDEVTETPANAPQHDHYDAADTLFRPVNANFVIGLCESGDGNAPLAETMLAAAKDACAHARRKGIGSIHIGEAKNAQRRQFEQLIAYAGQALARDAVTLSGQIVHGLSSSDLPPALHIAIGARDLSGNTIPPRLFLWALSRCENAQSVDLWAFKRTLQWLLDHEADADRFALAIVPLSAASFRDEHLPDRIVAAFMEIPLAPGKICFEIPDSEVVENRVAIRELVDSLKALGCRFVLDEFGSGHDSYDYIKEIDVDYVTVNSDFVNKAPHNRTDLAMAKSINELAHFAGKKTFAKQKRGADLADTMRAIGIDFLFDLTDQVRIAP